MYRVVVGVQGGPERELTLDRDVILVGRRAGADVLLPHEQVGGVHLRLEREAGQVVAVDAGAGTSGGTLVNGTRLPSGGRRVLTDGDTITVAERFTLRYSAVAHGAPSTPADTAQLARAMVQDLLAALGEGPSAARTPWLEVTSGPAAGTRLPLPGPGKTALLGRGETCELVVRDPDLSREHLRLERDLAHVLVTDLGSKNGTRRRNATLPLGVAHPLSHHDELKLGATTLRYHNPAEAYLESIESLKPPAAPPAQVAVSLPAAAAQPVSAEEAEAAAAPTSASLVASLAGPVPEACAPPRAFPWPIVIGLLVVVAAALGLAVLFGS